MSTYFAILSRFPSSLFSVAGVDMRRNSETQREKALGEWYTLRGIREGCVSG
jgi:hypothetical protein